jgi:putative transcriptional regulator
MKKRDLFSEMMQGVKDMELHRKGKITLRQFSAESLSVPKVSASEIVALRSKLNMSQQVFARRFRTSAETLRNWEQDKSKPNAQAAILIKLVAQYPDMFDRLAAV